MTKLYSLFILTFLVLLTSTGVVYSQSTLISGPTEVLAGSTQTYTCTGCGVFSEFGSGQFWRVTQGTIIGVNYNYNSVTVQWSATPGAATISWRDKWTIFTQKNITIGTLPATPPTPAYQYACTQGKLAVNGTPPSGTTWYWQTSSSGTSMTNAASEWVVTNSGQYFLRAKNPFGWSNASSVIYPGTDPSIPYAPVTISAERCQAGSITLSSNSTTDRWYAAITGGASFYTGTSYTTSFNASQTYYVEAVTPFNCVSTTRTPVTATVHPVTNGGTLSSSVSVFETANGTLTLSGSVGAIQKWQKLEDQGTWTDIASTSTTYNYNNVTVSATFRAVVRSGTCNEAYSSESSIVINPKPVVAASATHVIMGQPVTLDGGEGYASYAWKNAAQVTLGTERYYTTASPGAYKVTVTKSSVTGSATSAAFNLLPQLGSVNVNYTVSNVPQRAVKDMDSLTYLDADQLQQLIQYFDGLGRPIQSVITQGSPDKKDIVQSVVYDAFGREAVKYLPFVSAETNGWYKANAIVQQTAFYNTTDKVADDPSPFAVTIFEASPLNRIIKQGAPGTAWQPDAVNTYNSTDHSIKKSYEFNLANEVLLWSYSYPTTANPLGMVNAGSGTTPLYYAANQLYKSRTKDEHGNEVIEYTDKEGKTILKRVQAVSGSPAMNDSTYASTYFIYNDFGKEVCVIPPEAVKRIIKTNSEYFGKTDTQKNDFLKRWAYRYTYDGRLRQTQKQIPGAEPVYMVYNNRDLQVMSQDGNQRTQNKWLFTKYDGLNRPIVSGIYTHNTSVDQAGMSALISTSIFYETYNGDTSTHGYTNTVFSSPNFNQSGFTAMTVAYYDNYKFRDDLAGSAYNYVAGDLTGQASAFNRVTGLMTGTKVNILGTSNYLWSVNYYDDKYRTVQTLAQNHKNGIDRVTNVYDFVGKVVESKIIHTIGTVIHTMKRRIEYDQGQRPLKTWHKVNDKPEILLSAIEYNSLGEPVVKRLHSENNGTTFKQVIDYRYNIRGWLTRINNSDLTPDGNEPRDHFGMNLHYNDVASGINNTPQFNGNISATKYSNNQGFDPGLTERAYKYQYDALSRLTAATHFEKSASWNTSTALHEDNITYDLNTSILTMSRKGENGSQMDNLVFDYGTGVTRGNRLLKVSDSWDKTKGFVDGANTDNDYSYDANGNRITDKNKGITAYTYNYMNQREKVTFNGGNYLLYTYDAAGNKLSQGVYNSANVLQKKTDYVGEFFYENDTLKYISNEEGRYNVLAGAYECELRDHLGNNRVTFTTKVEQDAATATVETANLSAEQSKFLRYANAKRISSHLFDRTNGSAPSTTPGYAVRLSGSANERFGLARSFAVMPGDTVKAEVFVKYIDTNSSNWTSALNTLLTQIAGGTAPAGTVVDGGSYSSSTTSFPYAGLLNTSGSSGTGPKAYLNWLVFDKNFALVNGGYVRMSNAAREYGQDCAHEKLNAEIPIITSGFVYVYLSNENESIVDVFYDQFSVTLRKSPVINATDLYPYGAPAISYSREFSLKQDRILNGKETQGELGYNVVDLGQRDIDPFVPMFPTIDRFAEKYHWMSPYQYTAGNPVKFIDVNGDSIRTYFLDKNGNRINTIPEQVQNMFNSEYGIKVGYNSKTGMLYYDGEIETENTISESAKETIVNALQDETTGKQAEKKYGQIFFGYGDFGGKGPGHWFLGGATQGRQRAYIRLGDFEANGDFKKGIVNYSNLDQLGVSRRTYNMARVFEHEWVGHVLNKAPDGGARYAGKVEVPVNRFREEMGLPLRLNYGTERVPIFFGNRNSNLKQMIRDARRGLKIAFIP